MFKRVFIANRATAARRVVRACAELAIDSVAAYSDIDSAAPHLEEATGTARLPGYEPADTYLNVERVLAAAKAAGADALHPGYGFLAENADFARAVGAAGLRFIGPAPSWLANMGEKTQARAWMAAAGFPLHDGSAALGDISAFAAEADRIGYPVLVKPAAGGGGIGMARVETAGELGAAVATARAQAAAAFGDPAVYLERCLERPRHIEFQVIGDGDSLTTLLERECSVQRRHQKVIEEAPAPGLARQRLAEIETAAKNALASGPERRGYDSLGTVETLLADGAFGFLEMNARLQVEHGVTEAVTGVDLVAAQIRIASGARLGSVLPAEITATGHAVEARIYAEDSERMLPSSGRLAVFRPPTLAGVRVDAGYAEGQWVTPYFDPLLAKVIGSGATREQAIGRTLIGVKAFAIGGVATNQQLLMGVLGGEPFIAGRLHTQMLAGA